MNRRQLLAVGAACAVAPVAAANAEAAYLGDATFRASMSDGQLIPCFQGIDALIERCRARMTPIYHPQGFVARYEPYIRLIERYDRNTGRWIFYAGQNAARRDGAKA